MTNELPPEVGQRADAKPAPCSHFCRLGNTEQAGPHAGAAPRGSVGSRCPSPRRPPGGRALLADGEGRAHTCTTGCGRAGRQLLPGPEKEKLPVPLPHASHSDLFVTVCFVGVTLTHRSRNRLCVTRTRCRKETRFSVWGNF